MKSLIKTENLSVIYNLGKSNESPAILDIDLEIYPGEYIIFYGPSGCGKSTLLYCISGMEIPTKGKVWIQDMELTDVSFAKMIEIRRLWIGMVFQAYNLIPTLNVLDNVILPHLLGGFKERKIYQKADFLLKKFGISNLKNRRPLELSGGQQQRTAIVRSLMYNPQILLADEPVGNLDSKSSGIVMDLLNEINQKDKKTIILVTHDSQLLHYAHRVYYMKDGKIIREVANSDKAQIKKTKSKKIVSSELEKLARIFPYFSRIQLQSKSLANYIIGGLDIDRMQRLENIIQEVILKRINDKRFYELLNLPYKDGGIGFYGPTAMKYKKKVEEILFRARVLRKEMEKEKEKELDEKLPKELDIVNSLRISLLDSFNGQISLQQLERLDKAIRQRTMGILKKNDFQTFLDLPIKQGGVGLNRATARKFTRKLEVILSQTRKS